MKDLDTMVLQNRKGPKPRLYMVLDCETATLPFANEIAMTVKEKKNIAIAKPLIYDLAWRVVDRYNNVYAEHSFLIAETFGVPQIFNTAYYRDKRPIYVDRMNKKEITMVPWRNAIEVFERELKNVDFVVAFNAMFDFKKAIPFTELYINKLYSEQYFDWEKIQYSICLQIAKGKKNENPNQFDEKVFLFRGIARTMIDLWGVSCALLINTITYKTMCLEHDMISESGLYFKTSAESTFRYLQGHYAFEEAHTALEDVHIEAQILAKALHRAKVPEGIIFFPFRELGYTVDFLMQQKVKRRILKQIYLDNVIKKMKMKMEEYELEGKAECGFARMLMKHLATLETIL